MKPLRSRLIFATGQPAGRARLDKADLLILLVLASLVYLGVHMAVDSPHVLNGPQINLSISALPYYALLSVGRMLAAYLLSILFSLIYGYSAANNPHLEQILLPILDVLQSVPILSFLPIVLLGLTAVLPQNVGIELAAIILIFTSQAWNLTYSYYQSLKMLPNELREASAVFRWNWWWRFRRMELPFAAIGLLWNSVMSWAGGWFFLMAAETFTVGNKDFRLPGLGSFLQEAAQTNNKKAILAGIGTLVFVVVLLDQFIWRPLLAWSAKFKVEMVESDNPTTSWFLSFLDRSRLATAFTRRCVVRGLTALDKRLGGALKPGTVREDDANHPVSWVRRVLLALVLIVAILGAFRLGQLLITVPLTGYGRVLIGALATAIRVAFALIVAVLWTIPVGVAIGSNPKVATFLQPAVQIAASIPATALFPVLVLVLIGLPAGLNMAAVLLMLLGTQWYVLFNVIAGASAIPQDLRYTTDLLRLSRANRWRKLTLPALFPYLITGLVTASGGAWNASIIAEYTTFSNKTYRVTGLGSLISEATASGDYALLAASTLTMILVVVCINRFFWRRLYRLVEEKYRME